MASIWYLLIHLSTHGCMQAANRCFECLPVLTMEGHRHKNWSEDEGGMGKGMRVLLCVCCFVVVVECQLVNIILDRMSQKRTVREESW